MSKPQPKHKFFIDDDAKDVLTFMVVRGPLAGKNIRGVVIHEI